MRRLAIFTALACTVAILSSCGRSEHPDRELRAALTRTARLPHRYVYDDTSGGQKIVVQGVVEDDFRYKAEVVANGAVAFDEVASDDADARIVSSTLRS